MSRLVLIAYFIFFISGCADHNSTRLEMMKSELTELSLLVPKVKYPIQDYAVTIHRQICELSPNERQELFRFFEDTFEEPRLGNAPLAERQQSLEIYFEILRSVGLVFVETLDDQEKVWEFLLLAFDMFEQERDDISASSCNPPMPSCGLHIDKPQYLFELDNIRQRIFKDFFEQGLFGDFFWGLTVDKQKKWLSWLDFVARRNVHVATPGGLRHGMPQSFARLPPQMPLCMAAKRNRKTRHFDNPCTNSVVSCDDDL